MQSLNEMKLIIGEASNRYQILKSNFESFHAQIKTQIEQQDIKIKELVITPLINNEFNIEFCDRKLQFKFATAIKKDTNILYGYIDCSDDSRYLNVKEFEFNCTGISSYKAVESDKEQLNIINNNDALRIVMYFLYKSLCRR
jgi:hypothetical protein